MAQDFSTIYESLKAEAASYFGGLKGGSSQEDLIQEAALLIVENPAMDPAAAIKAARAALRVERGTFGGKQREIGFAYLSAKIGSEDGLTIGETLAKDEREYLNGLTDEQRAKAERWIAEGTLTDQVAAARVAGAERAHGADKAAQGAANAAKGALNDARLLEIVARCGGRGVYGLAGKVQEILAEEFGIKMEKLSINVAIGRAFKRTEGTDPHSSRD